MASGTGSTGYGNYEKGDGSTIDTGTESGIRAALLDIGHRLMALETAPGRAASTGGADADRLARLETAVAPFFREQLADYDAAAAAKSADGGAPVAPTGTSGNTGAGASG